MKLDMIEGGVAIHNAAKAAKMRTMASLHTAPDKLRAISHQLAMAGAERDAHELFKLATRIEDAFAQSYVPDLAI